MKKTFKTLFLFIGMSMFAVSCQKENIVEPGITTGEMQDYISISYMIDDVSMHAVFQDEASWREFLHWLFVLAEEGHEVRFGNSNRVQSLTKKTVTFTTTNQEEAEEWSRGMVKDGYDVSIIYNEKTGIYTCVAVK